MCPVCWISGFIAVLFGGSFIATINHPLSWGVGIVVIAYGVYKFYDGYKRGKSMDDTTKSRNRRVVYRFIQGIIIGSIVTGLIFYSLTYKEHEHKHELKQMDQPLIEESKIEKDSIVIFWSPTDKQHKKLHKFLEKRGIKHEH